MLASSSGRSTTRERGSRCPLNRSLEWASDLVWTFRERQKFLFPQMIPTTISRSSIICPSQYVAYFNPGSLIQTVGYNPGIQEDYCCLYLHCDTNCLPAVCVIRGKRVVGNFLWWWDLPAAGDGGVNKLKSGMTAEKSFFILSLFEDGLKRWHLRRQ
jgi:hypothetical protein